MKKPEELAALTEEERKKYKCADLLGEPACGELRATLEALNEARDRLETIRDVCGHEIEEEHKGNEDGECTTCAILDCPHAEPLHYHHDGCPSCIEGEPKG